MNNTNASKPLQTKTLTLQANVTTPTDFLMFRWTSYLDLNSDTKTLESFRWLNCYHSCYSGALSGGE